MMIFLTHLRMLAAAKGRVLAHAITGLAIAMMTWGALPSDSHAFGTTTHAAPNFNNGATSLFIGHSYFVPVAREFDAIAEEANFPLHSMDVYFRGGPNGAPQSLWENPIDRDAILQLITDLKPNLFGMTVHDAVDPTDEYYTYWIEAALAENPDVTIFIGQPHVRYLPRMDADEIDAANAAAAELIHPIVKSLREKFKGRTKIVYINYAGVMSRLKAKFEAGRLDGVRYLVANVACADYMTANGNPVSDCRQKAVIEKFRAVSVFNDMFGHMGPMGRHISALVWMHFLYDADAPSLIDTSTYDYADVLAIGTEVVRENRETVYP